MAEGVTIASGTAAALARANLVWIPPALLEASELRSFTADETLFRHGERPVAMLHVLEGEIRLVRRAPDGTEMILQRSRGGFIAEASMAAQAYHCDAVAASPGHLVRFPIGVLRKALDQDRDFRDVWMARLAQEVRKLRSQCERLGLRGAGQRVLHYIETEGTDGIVVLHQSRKAWAAELGLSHEALYRTLHRLEAEGILLVTGTTLRLTGRPVRSPAS